MRIKFLGLFLALVLVVGIAGVSATPTAKFYGFDKQKSINTIGVQEWKYKNGSIVPAFCINDLTWITNGYKKVTSGLNVANSNKIKLLIISYYNSTMTKQQGMNLQYAIWHYTNYLNAPNKSVKSMINKVDKNNSVIPNVYTVLLNSKTVKVSVYAITHTSLVNSTLQSNSVIAVVGTCVNTVSSKCKDIITTVTKYSNTTTVNTTNTYNTVVTTNKTYQTTSNYRTWMFNSIVNQNTQSECLFNVKDSKKTNTSSIVSKTCNSSSISNITQNVTYFYKTTTKIVYKHPVKPCKPVIQCKTKHNKCIPTNKTKC